MREADILKSVAKYARLRQILRRSNEIRDIGNEINFEVDLEMVYGNTSKIHRNQ